jgi:hypothetical protein
MRQERIIQATVFEVFAEHEIGRELKGISQWLGRAPRGSLWTDTSLVSSTLVGRLRVPKSRIGPLLRLGEAAFFGGRAPGRPGTGSKTLPIAFHQTGERALVPSFTVTTAGPV